MIIHVSRESSPNYSLSFAAIRWLFKNVFFFDKNVTTRPTSKFMISNRKYARDTILPTRYLQTNMTEIPRSFSSSLFCFQNSSNCNENTYYKSFSSFWKTKTLYIWELSSSTYLAVKLASDVSISCQPWNCDLYANGIIWGLTLSNRWQNRIEEMLQGGAQIKSQKQKCVNRGNFLPQIFY